MHRKYKIPDTCTRGILMRVASVGCFPGVWRRGSWRFQVASLHLQSSTDLSLSASHYFSFLSKPSPTAYAARGAKRLVLNNKYNDAAVPPYDSCMITMKVLKVLHGVLLLLLRSIKIVSSSHIG